ncbi:hypothetical protein K8942_05390 [Candidatus Peribacteria bacterium]|nr:MAG: hypothetical protein K8942_05390 [Candidatus Peribacteria bacterium]
MFPTPTLTPAQKEPFQDILERVALPLMLFSAVFFVLLFVSWFGILPRFTSFAVSDERLSPVEMETYVSHMKAELMTQEDTRNRLILPTYDEAYETLKSAKRSEMSAFVLRKKLEEMGVAVAMKKDAVVITRISTDGSTVTLSGDVRNVDLRSMTVLASFVEAVEDLSFVSNMTRPSFTREQNADGTFHSPFTITFTLATT